MKTSNYFTYRGQGRVSISRTVPKGVPEGYHSFKQLAPGAWIFDQNEKLSRREYHERYRREVLARLNPRMTYDALCRLTAPHEPVLLCWEDLTRPEQWCHRRLVAEWLEEELGIAVPEFVPAKVKKQSAQMELM